MLTQREAAYPSYPAPPTDIVGFYIGGNTPHIWSDAEIARDPAQYHLPIFVRSAPPWNVATDSLAIVHWARTHGMPSGTTIALDVETAIQPIYVMGVSNALLSFGYQCMSYGSSSFIFRNGRPSAGIWVADYTNTPHMFTGSSSTQYSPGGSWSRSLTLPTVPIWNTKASKPMPALSAPIVAIVAKSDNSGYWLVGADGGLFAFGTCASFPHTLVNSKGPGVIVAAVGTTSGNGLYVVGADGGVFCYGDASFHGNLI